MPIQQELHAASEKGDGFWMASTGDDENSVPFPFIATCLIMGASFNVDDVYHHSVSIESLYMQYDEGDNNNGERTCESSSVSTNTIAKGLPFSTLLN